MSNNNNNMKMKGLLKGLRYISQMFENEQKDNEMQIGLPTDVKHVAHIGWDGPSPNSPSLMNEYKGPENGGSGEAKADGTLKLASQGSHRRSGRSSSNSSGKDSDIPKSSRRQHSTGGGRGGSDSPAREKSEKTKRRSSKNSNRDSSDSPKIMTRRSLEYSTTGTEESSRNPPPAIPKKIRRKKSKENCVEGSSKTRSKPQLAHSDSDPDPFQKPFT